VGRALIFAGLGLLLLGVVVSITERYGRLPGDFVWRGRNTTVYFPLATSLLLSALLTLVMWLVNRRR